MPATITNGTKIIHTHTTLIREDVAHMLSLRSSNKSLEIRNALLNISSFQPKIVSFSVSSNLHPEKFVKDNAFILPSLNARYHKIDVNKIRSSFLSFKDVELPRLNNTDVTILTGADFVKLHIHKDFSYISDEDPCAVKTGLCWVLLESNKSSVCVHNNRNSTVVETLDLKIFWSIDSYGTVKKPYKILRTKDEKQAYGILEKSFCFNNGHYEDGML